MATSVATLVEDKRAVWIPVTGCVRDLPDVVVQLDQAIGVLAFYGQL